MQCFLFSVLSHPKSNITFSINEKNNKPDRRWCQPYEINRPHVYL